MKRVAVALVVSSFIGCAGSDDSVSDWRVVTDSTAWHAITENPQACLDCISIEQVVGVPPVPWTVEDWVHAASACRRS